MIAKAGEYSKESFEITGILTKKVYSTAYTILSQMTIHILKYTVINNNYNNLSPN